MAAKVCNSNFVTSLDNFGCERGQWDAYDTYFKVKAQLNLGNEKRYFCNFIVRRADKKREIFFSILGQDLAPT